MGSQTLALEIPDVYSKCNSNLGARPYLKGDNVKVCTINGCIHEGKLQPFDNFQVDMVLSDGYRNNCKDCGAKWRKKHNEKVKKISSDSKAMNRAEKVVPGFTVTFSPSKVKPKWIPCYYESGPQYYMLYGMPRKNGVYINKEGFPVTAGCHILGYIRIYPDDKVLYYLNTTLEWSTETKLNRVIAVNKRISSVPIEIRRLSVDYKYNSPGCGPINREAAEVLNKIFDGNLSLMHDNVKNKLPVKQGLA